MSLNKGIEQNAFKNSTQNTRNNLIISAPQHKIKINLNHLDQWFTIGEQHLQGQFLSSGKPNPMSSSEFLARFGIKSSADVMAYLKSDAGKTEVAVLLRECENLENLITEARFEALQEARREKMMLAFLLMGMIYSRASKANKLNQLLAYQIDKHLAALKEKNKKNAAKDLSESELQLQASIAAYKSQIEAYNQTLLALNQLLEKTQLEIHALTAEIESLEQKLTILAQELKEILFVKNEVDQDILNIYEAHPIHEQRIDAITRFIQQQEAFLLTLVQQVANTVEQPELPVEEQQRHVKKVEYTQIKLKEMKHFHLCELEHHVYIDEKGQKVDHFHQAKFAVPKHHYEKHYVEHKSNEPEIVYDENGQGYVIRKGENLNEIKNSENATERLAQAKNLYETIFVPHMRYLNKQLDNNQYNYYVAAEVQSKCKRDLKIALEKEDLLKNQIEQVTSLRDECTEQLIALEQQVPQKENERSLSSTNTLPMSPTPFSTVPTPKPVLVAKKDKNTSQKSSYATMLFKLSPELCRPDQINALRSMIKNVNSDSANRLRHNLNKLEGLPRNENVPEDLQAEIHDNLVENKDSINKNSPWYKVLHPYG